MRSIVTGGAGFIGSHLSEALINEGHEVIILDNFSTGRKENIKHIKNEVTIIDCDLSIKGKWVKEFKKVDWVFHLAALADIVPSIQKPEEYFNSNVTATLNVVEASKNYSVKRFIYSASSSCYGIPKEYPTKETAKIDCQYPYALTKRLGEEIVLHWARLYNLPALSLRFFNVYGTRSRTSGTYGAVFGVFLAQKLAQKPFTIVGDGNQTRDFTYVSDIVDALLVSMQSSITGEIFNVGSGKTISVNHLAELLKGEKTYIPKRPGEPDTTFADIKKIKKYLKWKPKVGIEEGVKEIINNIDYWKDAPVWTPETIKKATKEWFEKLG
mgnify:CR=1 FL=1|tara:strand:- start:108 stop:1085 length:978 start_codon:yes stop_codon:yes gene_type:complete